MKKFYLAPPPKVKWNTFVKPPSPGWYPASRLRRDKNIAHNAACTHRKETFSAWYRDPCDLRWWDGKSWSCTLQVKCNTPHSDKVVAWAAASTAAAQEEIAWARPWWVLAKGQRPTKFLRLCLKYAAEY